MRGRVGLTVATLLGLAVLLSLGTWQLRRLAWKEGLLARIEASVKAAPQPLSSMIDELRRGAIPEWTRVSAECNGSAWKPAVEYALENGEIAWRALSNCRIPDESLSIWIDRGVLLVGVGATEAPTNILPEPARVQGVLRYKPALSQRLSPSCWTTPSGGTGCARLTHPAVDYVLVAEKEMPQPSGVRPAPLPAQISNNHLGYAITWYGLAAALLGVYVAMLLGDRRRSRAV